MANEQKALQEAILYFIDRVDFREDLVARPWLKRRAPRCGYPQPKLVKFLFRVFGGRNAERTWSARGVLHG